jgi:hypothetical protein
MQAGVEFAHDSLHPYLLITTSHYDRDEAGCIDFTA